MSDADLSRKAADALRREVEPLPDSPEARREIVAAMEEALRGSQAAPRPRRLWMVALAASLALVAGAGLVALQRSGVARPTTVVASSASVGTLTAPGEAPRPLSGEQLLPEASRISTPQGGSAELHFSTGTRVALGSLADVTLDA